MLDCAVAFALLLGVLFAAEKTASAQDLGPAFGDPLPAKTDYSVTRTDPRMCPSPLCGGVYVKQVNRMHTRCADGTVATECYAPILDWSALPLLQREVWQVEDDFRSQRALARGELRIVDSSTASTSAPTARTRRRSRRGSTRSTRDQGCWWRAITLASGDRPGSVSRSSRASSTRRSGRAPSAAAATTSRAPRS